jgi:hypothetical protein
VPSQDKNASFVIRIWWEEVGDSPAATPLWRGWVQHARSGEAAYVQNLEALLSFMERWTGRLDSESNLVVDS